MSKGQSVAPDAAAILARLSLAVVLINLLVGGLAGVSLWQSFRQYQDRAAINANNLSQTISQYVSDVIDKVDYGLTGIVVEAERQIRQGGLNDRQMADFLRLHQSYQPMVEAVRLSSPQGIVLMGTAVPQSGRFDITDRDYFITQRDRADAGLVISTPHVSKISGKWSLYFSRRINDANGNFAGIAYMVMELERLSDFFSRIDVGPMGGISLRAAADMAIILRHPDPGGQFRGNKTLSPELKTLLTRGDTVGTYYSGTTWDGTARMVSFQKIGSYPLFINVGLASGDYLAPWWGEVRKSILFQLVFLVLTTGWAVHFFRHWGRRIIEQEQAQQTLEQRVVDQTASLQEYASALEQSNTDLEQFAYVASHDLREPLRMISSYLSLLERRYGQVLQGDGLDFLAYARDGAIRMDQLVLDLLEFSRVQRRGDPMVAMAVWPAVQQALDFLTPQIADSGAHIHLDPGLEGVAVTGDHTQIMRLMQNLIGNAIKYRAEGRSPRIEILCQRDGTMWQFSVVDNGIGIEPAYHDRIFGIFQRLHTRDKYDGTGIGLAVCKKIVERHGGDIWVRSEPGQGTAFIFTLPDSSQVMRQHAVDHIPGPV